MVNGTIRPSKTFASDLFWRLEFANELAWAAMRWCWRWFWRPVMGRICDLQIPGAGQVVVSVNTGDHCDPHVHCWDKAWSWEARIRFSFMNNQITFWDFLWARNNPRSSVITEIIRQIGPYLPKCRGDWWQYYSGSFGCCLKNTQQVDNAGVYRQVHSATYNATASKTELIFVGGFTREVPL